MANKAKHAFGAFENIDAAISAGTIDSYDILFVKDANGKPYVGWVDKQGQKVIVDNSEELNALATAIATKVSADEVDTKIAKALDGLEGVDVGTDVEYEISYKPDGTLVDYRDKEIRVMCPADTQFELQSSGEGADANSFYIGLKAYAPSDDVVSFKEDLAETITDEEMYYFEDNEFAGIDENGKYSIVWLPVAKYDGSTWTYYGANSSAEKYIGWYYSVEWYDANGAVVGSDCIRINLSNEDCHSEIKPYYWNELNAELSAKINEIENKVEEVSCEVVEF